MSIKFLGNTIIFGKIELLTGMHIGGSSDNLSIGGIDSPVIRDPETDFPYIPGSSLKGKLRMITELSTGNLGSKAKDYVCDCGKAECPVCRIFGSAADPDDQGDFLGPTRIIVRDAFPDEGTIEMWDRLDEDYLFTEGKSENVLNRLTAEANPRVIERAVKGSKFNFHITLGKYEINGKEDSEDDFKTVIQAMKILEDSGLGGNVSRGYGRVKFHLMDPVFVSVDDYYNGSEIYEKTRQDSDGVWEKNELKKLSEIKC